MCGDELLNTLVRLIVWLSIRRSADIVIALALEAKAVLIGRPYAWGLAVDGEIGVRTLLQRLRAEFDLMKPSRVILIRSNLKPVSCTINGSVEVDRDSMVLSVR